MVLMSSLLLLCELTALLTLAAGNNMKLNNTNILLKNVAKHKQLLLNVNRSQTFRNFNEKPEALQHYASCNKCYYCMNQAIERYKSNYYTTNGQEKMEDNVIIVPKDLRVRRDIKKEDVKDETPTEVKSYKKNRMHVTVTKFNMAGEVYALRIKEKALKDKSNKQKSKKYGTCKVYSIKDSFPCDSPESEKLISKISKKKKANNRKLKSSATGSKKRQADFEIQETYMPSIEDMYS